MVEEYEKFVQDHPIKKTFFDTLTQYIDFKKGIAQAPEAPSQPAQPEATQAVEDAKKNDSQPQPQSDGS